MQIPFPKLYDNLSSNGNCKGLYYNFRNKIKTAMIIAYLIPNPQFNIWNISYITSHPFFTGSLEVTNDQLPMSVAS